MSSALLIMLLSALVVLVAALRAAQAIRHDRANGGRGTRPAKGDSVIDATYCSGGAGGGQAMSYRIPRDPQAYAEIFIPKDRT